MANDDFGVLPHAVVGICRVVYRYGSFMGETLGSCGIRIRWYLNLGTLCGARSYLHRASGSLGHHLGGLNHRFFTLGIEAKTLKGSPQHHVVTCGKLLGPMAVRWGDRNFRNSCWTAAGYFIDIIILTVGHLKDFGFKVC